MPSPKPARAFHDGSRTVAAVARPGPFERAGAALALLALLSLLAGAARAGEIAVSASGVAYGPPDMASLDVGFTTAEEDVGEALDAADAAIRSVRAALANRGIDDRDVRTTVFTVWREERFDDRQTSPSVVYRVTHHLQVTVRDVESVGEVLVAATDAGANHVGGIRFSVLDARELEATARTRAFEAALDKARQLARLAGVELGPPTAVVESGPGAPIGLVERSAVALSDAGAPVEAGQLAVEVRLEVRFDTTR